MNYFFFCLIVTYSFLTFLQNATEDKVSNQYGMESALYTLLYLIVFAVLSIRYLGFWWGILATGIILFILPDTLGFILYFYIKSKANKDPFWECHWDKKRKTVFLLYRINFYLTLSFTVTSFYVTEYKSMIWFLIEKHYLPIYILASISVIMFIVREFVKYKYLNH